MKTCWDVLSINPNNFDREVELAEEVCNDITVYVSEVECGNADGSLRMTFEDALSRLEDFGSHISDHKEEQLFDEVMSESYRVLNLISAFTF